MLSVTSCLITPEAPLRHHSSSSSSGHIQHILTHTIQPCLKPLERPPSHTPASGTSSTPSRESSDACPSESQRPSWESTSRSMTLHVTCSSLTLTPFLISFAAGHSNTGTGRQLQDNWAVPSSTIIESTWDWMLSSVRFRTATPDLLRTLY